MSTPNIDSEILKALYTRLDEWTPPAGMKVVYPLERFTPTGQPYIRVSLLYNTKARQTINRGGIHSLPGILQATFIYPVPTSVQNQISEPVMLERMGSLITHFTSDTKIPLPNGGYIRVTSEPSIGGQMITADKVQMSVSINWQVFD